MTIEELEKECNKEITYELDDGSTLNEYTCKRISSVYDYNYYRKEILFRLRDWYEDKKSKEQELLALKCIENIENLFPINRINPIKDDAMQLKDILKYTEYQLEMLFRFLIIEKLKSNNCRN